MGTINWIILQSKDRGTNYGVGTFIKHFTNELAQREGFCVFVLEVGATNLPYFKSEKVDGITYLMVPQLKQEKAIDTKTNQIKIAKSIRRVVSACIPEAEKNIVHLNFLFEYFIAGELATALNARIMFTQHITLFDTKTEFDNFNLEEEVCKLADAIVPVSNNGKNYLLQKSAPSEKLVTIHNGISPKLFIDGETKECMRAKYGLRKDTKLILYSGRLDAGKGLNYLLEAFQLVVKKNPDCHLILAGDGDFKEIIELARPISSRISYLGFIPFSDLIALYRESIIGVIPSLKEECSYVALEMLHSGLPVVACNVGGLKEIFSHNKDALLVEMATISDGLYNEAPRVDQLADYMDRLLTNQQIREKFSINAKEKAQSQFTDIAMIDKYTALLDKLF